MADLTANEFSLVLLVLRVLLGLVFASHGLAKRKGGLGGTAAWFDGMGMRPGKVHAQLASLTEIGTGLLLVVGFLTPFAAAGVVGVMVVAGYTTHRENGFFIVKNGWEYTFMVALMAVAIGGLGAGDWSVDAALDLDETWNGMIGLGIAILLGAAGGIAQLLAFYRPPAKA